MFKQIILPLLATTLFIILVGILFNDKSGFTSKIFPSPTPSYKQIKVGDIKINVDLADTAEERQKGLSGRETIAENYGLLFVFDKKDVFPSFWMKDMRFAIDIIWINDGKVNKIDKNIQPDPPGTPDDKLKLYRPDKPVDYALEVNSGYCDKNNLKVGDSVDLSEYEKANNFRKDSDQALA